MRHDTYMYFSFYTMHNFLQANQILIYLFLFESEIISLLWVAN